MFGEFYRDQQQLRDLIEQLYLPIMEDYFTAYADSINEIDQKEPFFTQFLRLIFLLGKTIKKKTLQKGMDEPNRMDAD